MKNTTFAIVSAVLSAALLAGCAKVEPITVSIPDAEVTTHITREFTCQGAAKPLRFRIADVPKSVTSIALIFEDLEAEDGTYVHWVVYNAPASTAWLTAERLADGAVQGLSTAGAAAYIPPCPPTGLHRYRAEVLGLDTMLSFDAPPTAEQLRAQASGHVVARGEAEVIHNTSAADDLPL